MRGSYVYPEDYMELLENLPDSLPVVHAYLAGKFGVLAVRSDAASLWRAIVEQRGEEGAEDVVSELVITKGGRRVQKLIQAIAEDRDVHIRADDPPIVRQLFDHDGMPTDLGYSVGDYWERSRPGDDDDREDDDDDDVLARPSIDELEDLDEQEPEDEDEDHGDDDKADDDDGPNLMDLLKGRPRPSAAAGTGWRFERVEAFLKPIVTVESNWTEKALEDFVWANWEQIDFGLDGPLYLIERQATLSPKSADRVDFLARGENGLWFAVELKISKAGSSDFTQLLSYLADLAARGVPQKKIRGILIAPGFKRKVLNAAATEPRVTLLRFGVA